MLNSNLRYIKISAKLFTIIALFAPFVSFSQHIDSAFCKAGYFFTIKDSITKKVSYDSLIVEIGTRFSLCYSEWGKKTFLMIEKAAKDYELELAKSKTIDFTKLPPRKYGMNQEICKNLRTGTVTVTDRIVNDKYYYEDNLDKFNWDIYPDTATISGYLCQKAETNFRGRHYISWFTNQIPIQSGPLKFGGLPGLIVKLKDDKDKFSFVLVSFEKLPEKTKIEFNTDKAMLVSRRKLYELKKAFFDNPMAFINSNGSSITINSINPPPTSKYDPLELE